ncbi:glycosyltransferase family 4 protein [Sanguibacteroides sp. AM78-02pH3A]|uniref:glycosyltransferase family 4 protein n=1 Tax=Sanguibacteroides sp. AM78-02pH3A TaxID=3002646 RepID=UPI0022E2D893|nr:glycosyltransferase family 4 protein [Sanguibacteroides sp. AM78-02pH3A]
MKILLVTQYFYPENFKSNDIAFELQRKGYTVTVLTGIPNYPSGKFFQGYGLFKKRKQTIQGVRIIRSWLISRGHCSGFRLALNYFSWAFFASWKALWLGIWYKYDAIIVHEPSPITQGIPAIIVKKIQKIPLYFWVLDLWPESLISAGGVHNKLVLSFFNGIVKYVYKNADKLLISSRKFKDSIIKKGNFIEKLIYFPNWAEDVFKNSTAYPIPALPDGFKVMFAGNIGEAQDFEHIMQAILLLKEKQDIQFIFIGDGRKRPWIEEFIKKHNLTKTVHILGRFPLEAMPAFFEQADAMLLALKDESIFNLTVPAKLQAYMAAGKPVIAMLNGEGAEIIKEAACGLVVNAGDYTDLAKNILLLKTIPTTQKKQMGEKGKQYCSQYFNKQICIDHLIEILKI